MDEYSYSEKHISRTERKAAAKKERSGRTLSWALCIAIAVGIAFFVRTFIFEPIRVDGNSMYPTLLSGQSIGVEKVARYFSLPERGNIVIVHYPYSKAAFVKRCVALPGDSIEIRDSVVYINGEATDEDYINPEPYADMEKTIVPEEHIFVMGDNRANSQDSRYVGPIPRKDIVGHAMFVMWPFSEAKLIN